MVAAPTLLDSTRIRRTLKVSVPRGWASWITLSPTRRVGGSTNSVSGVTRSSSMAAATVTALKIDPGSKTSVTTRLRVNCGLRP